MVIGERRFNVINGDNRDHYRCLSDMKQLNVVATNLSIDNSRLFPFFQIIKEDKTGC
jgi:hypothetical protein